MADKHRDVEQKRRKDDGSKIQQKGGLPQEESEGPGSVDKRRNQREDGQLEQGRENDQDHQRRNVKR